VPAALLAPIAAVAVAQVMAAARVIAVAHRQLTASALASAPQSESLRRM